MSCQRLKVSSNRLAKSPHRTISPNNSGTVPVADPPVEGEHSPLKLVRYQGNRAVRKFDQRVPLGAKCWSGTQLAKIGAAADFDQVLRDFDDGKGSFAWTYQFHPKRTLWMN